MKSTKVFLYNLLIGTTLIISSTLYAAQSPTPPNALLHIQYFKKYPVDIQFRYVNLKLTYLRFQNVSNIPVVVHIFRDYYILGPQDFAIIDPPRTNYLYYTVGPYEPFASPVNNIFSDRFNKLEIYRLPPSTDNAVEK